MIKRLRANREALRYIQNSSWMLAEYGLKVISAIFVSIYVARFLGPAQFGILSYALAIAAIFIVISRLGMESILVRDLARFPDDRQAYMSTAFGLMSAAALLAFLVLAGLVFWLETDPSTQLYIWIISASILFQTFLVVDYSFQAQVKAKYASIAKSIALIFSAINKLVLVWLNADLVYFALFYALDHLVTGLVLLAVHGYTRQPAFFKGFQARLVKPLLSSAWPMVLSAVAATIYMRVDQIMIKNMLGAHELGLYAAAAKIYEGWIIFPFVISISLLPAIVRLKQGAVEQYEKNMARLFSLLFWSSAAVALIATLAGDAIITLTFGSQFAGSGSVLAIVMWSSTFAALGSGAARYLTVEGMEKKIAIRTLLGALLNALLNLLLIPRFGIHGAAVATLITFFFCYYLINYFDAELQKLVSIENDAIALSWLWLKNDTR
jgi:O-antigen/teichoic acid export membrane protein